MLDWFWNWGPIAALSGAAAQTRQIDPIWLLVGVMLLVFALVWALNRPPTVRENRSMGQSYRGKLSPRTLHRMLAPPQKRQVRTRDELYAAVERSRRARARGEPRRQDEDAALLEAEAVARADAAFSQPENPHRD
ncbi:hypothetical protein GE300_22365 [Rhodobacteraceae bacterium 2CG4]|uniref:Uncharacterized protein n=1 Tax=Halovulum marinum TaxID=2662447 RepID=A0A6L5Z6T5_9RHOB|nr:hypothetical protein [Halovulum marinum]MSU92278.1 hypothetical protein [Halovulum marinum]